MSNPLARITRNLTDHKYLWTILFFVGYVGFIDPNSFYQRYKLQQRNNELREEIKRYEESYAQSTRELQSIGSSQKALERVARVNLYMKTADEDVYVIE